MKISVLTPTYNSLKYLKEALDSLFAQDYRNFELIICNDSEQDAEALKTFLNLNYNQYSSQIILEQNEKNLGYALNMRKCFEKASGDIIFLFAQDDIILSPTHFSEIIDVYNNYPNVGFTSRPYFWFDENISNKLRRTPKSSKNIIQNDESRFFIDILGSSLGQLSGLSFKKLPNINYYFTPYIFTSHIYPFFQNFLITDCYFFSEDTIAVRMSSSQTTFVSSIYNPSPTYTWVLMINEVFKSHTYLRNVFTDGISKNYLGLLQIKNYGYFNDLLSDIKYLIYYRKKNLLNPVFWIFVFTVLFVPKKILIKLIDFYKKKFGF